MSGNKVKWILELQDRASGPARKVEGALVSLNRAQRFSGRSRAAMSGIERYARTQGRATRATETATNAMSDLGAIGAGAVAGIAVAAIAGAAHVARLTYELGRSAVEAADWRNRLEGGFRVLLRGDQAFGGVTGGFQRVSAYAQRFGLDIREVGRQMVQLTAAGFNQVEIPRVLQAAGDLGALEGPQAAERAITAIRQIRAKGVLQMEELQGQLADAGLNVGDVVNQLARSRGMRGTDRANSAAIRQLITGKRIDAQEGINAILQVIADRGGGRLGNVLDTQSRGAEAAMNRLSNAWLLLRSNFAQSPAFGRIIDFISRIAASLDPASESSRRFSAQIDRLFTFLTGPLASVDLARVFTMLANAIDFGARAFGAMLPLAIAFISGVAGPLRATAPVVVGMLQRMFAVMFSGGMSAETFRQIGTVLGVVASVGVGAIGLLIAAVGLLIKGFSFAYTFISAAWTRIIETFRSAPNTLLGFIGAAITGFMDGLIAGFGAVAQRVANFFGVSFPQVVKDALGIHSPSRVFAKIGMQTTAGFTQGMQSGEGSIASAANNLVRIPTVIGNRNTNSSSVVVNLTVQAPQGGDATSWAEDLADAIGNVLNSRNETGAFAS